MIQALPCPGCHRVLVLTAQASLQAVLRCRHCSHQFVLGEMIEAELGYWEVVDDPNAPELKAVGASDDAEIELAKDEYVSPQMLMKAEAEKKKTDWSKFEPITHEQYERMRRKGKSPIWSMLSVLLGGLASIPIATLLIWHVLGKDPLQMGPTVARFAPWIVPTRFRPSNFDEEPLPTAPLAGESGLPRVNAPAPNPRWANGRQAPRVFPAPSISSGLVDEEPAKAEPESEPIPIDVFSAINLVKKDLEAWHERGDDKETIKQIALRTYSNLATLALAIHQLPSPSPIRRLVRTELNAVGKDINDHADIQDLIQKGSIFWLGNHKEDLVGLAITIKVASLSETEDAWQVTSATKLSEEAIQIVVPKEVVPSLAEGQDLLAIGCLTREKPPAQEDSSASPESSEPSESSNETTKPASIFTANYGYVLKP